MAYWLLKSEPDVYSYADLERDRQTIWDGVNNNLALKHIRTMQIGDRALIYHTGDERRAMGIAEVITSPYVDPKLDDPKRAVVDVKAIQILPKPVTLSEIKKDHDFEGFDLIRISRLSVVPVSELHWQKILKLANTL
ncbi:MAG: ubiquinol-cytochrome C reductase [Oscillatoriales cyanobacterium CG2_30_44_21]|nr:MAG: ubiquinol-cytochrome C reductase [Oscillatoriales cyanobacterium CG2_30_44_21]